MLTDSLKGRKKGKKEKRKKGKAEARPLQQQEATKPDSAAAIASVPAGVGPDTPPQTQQGRREAALEHARAAPCQQRQDDRAQTAGLLQSGASTVPGLDASAPP